MEGRGTQAYLIRAFDEQTFQGIQHPTELGQSVRLIGGDVGKFGNFLKHPRENSINDTPCGSQVASGWENALGDCDRSKGEINRIRGKVTDLAKVPHTLHLLYDSIHRFLASVKPVLVIGVHETVSSIQHLVDFVDLSFLTAVEF